MNKILWSPTKEQIDSSNLESLRQIINLKYDLNLSSYLDIHDWSVKNIEQFWEIVWNDTGIIYSQTFTKVVDDVDKMYERVLECNIKPLTRPADAPWGERYFHLCDPDGNELSFARPLDD